jgi:hypothetical protein
MNEEDKIPILEPEPETQDQVEEKQRLKATLADMEKNQLAFLDEAGKVLSNVLPPFSRSCSA